MKRKGRIVVLGAGESGVGAAYLAKKKGYEVFVSDLGKIKKEYQNVLLNNAIEWEEEQHSEDLILNADVIIKSPGIPPEVAIIKQAIEQGVEVIDEVEFASRFTQAKLICITGSNGKTTTTLLLHHVLKKAGLNVGLAGNVGQSFARLVADEEFDYCVLELSSFQLDGLKEFRAHIAILLNITPDHLDRYEYKMENYVQSKFQIVNNQRAEDAFIYCLDDKEISSALKYIDTPAKHYPFSQQQQIDNGAYIENNNIIITVNNKQLTMSVHDLALQGKHNANNSMAAGIAAKVLEIRKEIIRESLSDFQNVEHRLEFVAKIHGIEFINDSKATNVNATWYALECQMHPVVWIVGGVDKGNDYETLLPLVKDKVKAIVCLGKDSEKLSKTFGSVVENLDTALSAEEAVMKAYQFARKGDAVLLSPACASFDLFDNYEDRGQQFKKAVRAL